MLKSFCFILPAAYDFLGAIYSHCLLYYQLGSQALNLLTLGACCNGDLSRMQGHVPALDAFGGQGTQGSHVLGQFNRNDDFGQLGGGFDAAYPWSMVSRLAGPKPIRGGTTNVTKPGLFRLILASLGLKG